MTRGPLLTMLALLLLGSACSTAAEPTETTSTTATTPNATVQPVSVARRAVIVDYSPTVSDVGALLYLLSHPDVDVLAITLPVAGEAGCELGIEVTLGILNMLDRSDIPVACDSESPVGAKEWPAEFLTGRQALTSGLPKQGDAVPDSRPAHQLIADTVADSDQPVTIVAVAPLTNVARALELHPEVAGMIDRVVIMGGAIETAGNVPGTAAEWNLWIDAPSAASVFGSGAPITLVPLDATDDVPVPAQWQSDLEGAGQSESVGYLTSLVRIFPAVTSGFYYLWDELAAAVAAGEHLVTFEAMGLLVTDDGSTVRDPAGAPVRVATAVDDPNAFYAHFLATISGEAVEQRMTVTFDETTVPGTVDAASSPEEVLAFWIIRGFEGDVEAAASVVAPGAAWLGFGATPDEYVDGAQPYQAFDVEAACTSAGVATRCDATFRDLWIDGIPELERGGLSVGAEVSDGMITSFVALAFDADTIAAFDAHNAWLQAEQPEAFVGACAANPFGRECSELFVTTVEDWVATR